MWSMRTRSIHRFHWITVQRRVSRKRGRPRRTVVTLRGRRGSGQWIAPQDAHVVSNETITAAAVFTCSLPHHHRTKEHTSVVSAHCIEHTAHKHVGPWRHFHHMPPRVETALDSEGGVPKQGPQVMTQKTGTQQVGEKGESSLGGMREARKSGWPRIVVPRRPWTLWLLECLSNKWYDVRQQKIKQKRNTNYHQRSIIQKWNKCPKNEIWEKHERSWKKTQNNEKHNKNENMNNKVWRTNSNGEHNDNTKSNENNKKVHQEKSKIRGIEIMFKRVWKLMKTTEMKTFPPKFQKPDKTSNNEK